MGNDICVGNIADGCECRAAVHPGSHGLRRRVYPDAGERDVALRMVYGFENNRLLPDNSWLLLRTDWLDYQRSDMWMAKMLPYPAADSVVRGTSCR